MPVVSASFADVCRGKKKNTRFFQVMFVKNLVFHGKYLLFLAEGRHHTLKKVGIGCRGYALLFKG